VIKREIGKWLGVKLHTLGYCHIVVGISWVKVGELFGRGYQDKVREINKAEIGENKEDIIKL
jgi:hypothetical protein